MDPRIEALNGSLIQARRRGRPLLLTGLQVHIGDGSPARQLPVGIAAGRFTTAAADADATILDLSGWTLLPGLCDAHLHLFHQARRALRVVLSGLLHRSEIWDRLAAGAATGPLMAVGSEMCIRDSVRDGRQRHGRVSLAPKPRDEEEESKVGWGWKRRRREEGGEESSGQAGEGGGGDSMI